MSKQTIDFIGIGAPKSGSTWIGKCLEDHPDILFSSQKSRKEIFFFTDTHNWVEQSEQLGRLTYYHRGFDWYLDQFPAYEEGKVRGEFTTAYLADKKAPERIKKHLPNVKLLVTLRNPVEMIYSLHWYLYNGAFTNLDPDFKVTLEKGLLTDKGYYAANLKRYFEHFDKNKIKIILFDDINKDAAKVIKEIYNFLGVDDTFAPNHLNVRVNEAFTTRSKGIKKLVHNSIKLIDKMHMEKLRLKLIESHKLQKVYATLNKTPAKYPKITNEIRKLGYEVFKEDIAELEELLGRDLSIWNPNKNLK